MMNGVYNDRIRHILYSIHAEPLIITDPIGYETSNEEFTRTFENVGIIANFSADLKFVNDGKDFISNIANNYGLNEVITIRREERNKDNEWVEVYSSTLDLSTYSTENGQVSVKINSGGFDKLFKSRENEKLEIESEQAIDGGALPALGIKNLTLQGRRIFFKSLLEISDTDNSAYMHNFTDAANVRGKMVTVPLKVKYQSDVHVNAPTPNLSVDNNQAGQVAGEANGETGLMFFTSADRTRVLNLNLDISFKFNLLENDDLDWSLFYLRIAKYENGVDFNLKSVIDLYFSDNLNSINGQTISESFAGNITVEAGESLSLQFCQRMKGNSVLNESNLTINCTNIVATLNIEEDSVFQPTTTQTLLIHDLGERLTSLITGKQNKFTSNILGRTEIGYENDGKWGYLGTYSGQWLRGFTLADYNPDPEQNRYKKYTTSFKDYVETLKSIFNLHVGFQSNGFDERVIVEDLEYFFNPNIVIVLPNPLTNVKRYAAEDLIFSGVKLGYEKGGEVEGIMGLDEPNGQANWVSNMTVSKNPLEKLSKYIAGVYDEEKQRRIQKEISPTEDTDRDKDIYIKDLILDEGILRERVWQDDYDLPPTGIFSPETAKNLRLSPAQNLRRHGNILATPLEHYQDKFLSFGSSTANSGMTNYLPSGAISENENVLNSKLGNRLFEPFYIEGNHEVDFDIMSQIKGESEFSGIKIPNFYCKVQFTTEDEPGVTKYGFIMSVKPGGEGNWKFIEAANISIS